MNNCIIENIEGCIGSVIQDAFCFDKEIAQGISNGAIYECYLIFSSKWKLIKLLFEIHDFFQVKRLKNFFYSNSQHNLTLINKKLLFFVSFIKSKTPEFWKIFSEDILEYYNQRMQIITKTS